MEFVAKKADLLRELGLCQRIVEKRNTIPILANILLETDNAGVMVTATDLEVGIKSFCAAKVKSAGAVTVSAKKLFEVVRSLPDEDVRVRAAESNGIILNCGRSEFRLVGLDAKDYPNLPACDFRNAWEAPAGVLHRLLSKVLFSVTTDESRFPISGLLFLASRDHLTVVATDGHRLAIAECDQGLRGAADGMRLVMPKKALIEVKQISEMGNESVACEVRENHIYFRIGSRILVARMVEDQFPAYEKVVPRGNDKILAFTKADLEGAVRRASVLSSEKARAVRFHLKRGTLVVSASNPELGEAREEIGVGYEGEEFEIAFNAQYIIDFLGVAETEKVQIELKDGATQALFRPAPEKAAPAENENSSSEGKASAREEVRHYYVLMPMRL